MCRVLAYLGEPISLAHVLFETDSSLVRQSYSPRMMETFLNLAGFGMAAWDPRSVHADDPFTYRVTTLPGFDRNLRNLAAKLAPTCLVAHVRGVTDAGHDTVAESNLHPFHFPGTRVAMAHNGHLREFARMRYDLVEHVRPELAQSISGTNRLRVDLRARAVPARGSARRAGGARARQRRRRRAAPPARGPGAARDRHLVAR